MHVRAGDGGFLSTAQPGLSRTAPNQTTGHQNFSAVCVEPAIMRPTKTIVRSSVFATGICTVVNLKESQFAMGISSSPITPKSSGTHNPIRDLATPINRMALQFIGTDNRVPRQRAYAQHWLRPHRYSPLAARLWVSFPRVQVRPNALPAAPFGSSFPDAPPRRQSAGIRIRRCVERPGRPAYRAAFSVPQF